MFLDILVNLCHRSIFRYSSVLDYLNSRYITNEDIEKYKLGYSRIISLAGDKSSDWERFVDECKKGIKFENKIIFPLRNETGKIIGISGRGIESKEFKNFVLDEGKYTGFFFGLYDALPFMYEKNSVFIVEGAIDRISLSKVIPNTVALLTAGLNDAQYDLLKFYCDYIVVVFDSDKTGKYAEKKALEREGLFSLSLGYKDPARCLEYLGPEKFKEFIKKKLLQLPQEMFYGNSRNRNL